MPATSEVSTFARGQNVLEHDTGGVLEYIHACELNTATPATTQAKISPSRLLSLIHTILASLDARLCPTPSIALAIR